MRMHLKQHPLQSPGYSDRGGESAISPVVGVMLMLVVTIIIAAVVAGFSGGLIGGGNQKTPTLNMDVSIANSGDYRGSGFSATVTGVSDPISTGDLKLVTSWTTTVKTNTYTDTGGTSYNGVGCILSQPLGTAYHGGAEVIPGVANTRTSRTYTGNGGVAPFGSGPGVEGTVPYVDRNSYSTTAYFGNYNLNQGTIMAAVPIGGCLAGQTPVNGGYPSGAYYYGGYGVNAIKLTGTESYTVTNPRTGKTYNRTRNILSDINFKYQYTNDGPQEYYVYHLYSGTKTTPSEIITDGGQVDNMQAVLGCGWENLRAGDTVNVKLIYTPTGRTIFDKDVVVTG